jgi:hypothetical protein
MATLEGCQNQNFGRPGLVFKGPVWSGILTPRDMDQDQDQFILIPRSQKTGLDGLKLVYVGFLQS